MIRKLPVTQKECTGCMACKDACTQNAIFLSKGELGFSYPKIESGKCINCGACENVCPVNTAKIIKDDSNVSEHFYAVRANDEKIRASGSSGGFFPMLARYVIEHGGVVTGASLCEDCVVRHIIIDKTEDICKITKTKYVQSATDGIYDSVIDILKSGKVVLFAGTPCQVEAMRKLAPQYKDKLILLDVICYGVPSPDTWKKYVKVLEHKYKGKLEAFYFRDKRGADNGHTAVAVVDGREYEYSLFADRYCRTYFKNVNIRRSCFNCKFADAKRNSDFTIGDFWGIENVAADLDDKLGVSLVITHTDKAVQMLEELGDKLVMRNVSREQAMQPRLESPTVANEERDKYIRYCRFLPFRLWLRLVNR